MNKEMNEQTIFLPCDFTLYSNSFGCSERERELYGSNKFMKKLGFNLDFPIVFFLFRLFR